MALSGLAVGAIVASYVGRLAGYPDVISIDMGGTSTDICLKDYGVVLDPQTLELDEVETARLHKELRRETALFHRSRYLHAPEG